MNLFELLMNWVSPSCCKEKICIRPSWILKRSPMRTLGWWFSAGGCPAVIVGRRWTFTLSIHLHIRWNLGAHAQSWATLQWGWSPMVEEFGTPGLTGTSNWPDELLWRSVILIVCLRKWVGWSVDAHLLTKSSKIKLIFVKDVWETMQCEFPLPLLSSSFLFFPSTLPTLFFPSPFLFHVSIVSLFLFPTGWDRVGAQVGAYWSTYPEDPQHLHPPGQRYPQLLCSQQRESHVHLIIISLNEKQTYTSYLPALVAGEPEKKISGL